MGFMYSNPWDANMKNIRKLQMYMLNLPFTVIESLPNKLWCLYVELGLDIFL